MICVVVSSTNGERLAARSGRRLSPHSGVWTAFVRSDAVAVRKGVDVMGEY